MKKYGGRGLHTSCLNENHNSSFMVFSSICRCFKVSLLGNSSPNKNFYNYELINVDSYQLDKKLDGKAVDFYLLIYITWKRLGEKRRLSTFYNVAASNSHLAGRVLRRGVPDI